MSINSSHGGFPGFIFNPTPREQADPAINELVAEGPFASYAFKSREAERDRTSAAAGGQPFSLAEPFKAGPSSSGLGLGVAGLNDRLRGFQVSESSKNSSIEHKGGEAMQRQSQAANMSQQQGNGNGPNGAAAALNGMGVNIPVNAGQQMDLNMVFQRVMELSEVLKENRERTQGIVASAEELAVSSFLS